MANGIDLDENGRAFAKLAGTPILPDLYAEAFGDAVTPQPVVDSASIPVTPSTVAVQPSRIAPATAHDVIDMNGNLPEWAKYAPKTVSFPDGGNAPAIAPTAFIGPLAPPVGPPRPPGNAAPQASPKMPASVGAPANAAGPVCCASLATI